MWNKFSGIILSLKFLTGSKITGNPKDLETRSFKLVSWKYEQNKMQVVNKKLRAGWESFATKMY